MTAYLPILEKNLEIHIIKKLTTDVCRVFKAKEGENSDFLQSSIP